MGHVLRSVVVGMCVLVLGGCAVDVSQEDAEVLGMAADAVSNSQAVGVIPIASGFPFYGTTCPRETTSTSSPIAELVGLHMDDEDTDNMTWHTNGWEAPQTTVLGQLYFQADRNTDFRFCRVDGSAFRAKTDDPSDTSKFYAVLSLGLACPAESERVGIYIDNEDDANADSSFGAISPNSVVNGNTTLFFCVFRSSPGAHLQTFPNFGASYGVFHNWEGTQPSWVISKHTHESDDEDDNNQNHWVAGSAGAKAELKKMVQLGINTRFDLARVR